MIEVQVRGPLLPNQIHVKDFLNLTLQRIKEANTLKVKGHGGYLIIYYN